jgi:hypothetical protein
MTLNFECVGSWVCPITQRRKTWVRFSGDAESPDAFAFSRIFDSIDCLLMMCRRDLRTALALDPRAQRWDRCAGHLFCQELTCADREQIEILRSREQL